MERKERGRAKERGAQSERVRGRETDRERETGKTRKRSQSHDDWLQSHAVNPSPVNTGFGQDFCFILTTGGRLVGEGLTVNLLDRHLICILQ